MRAPLFTTLRGRAIILALLSALPPCAVMFSMAVQWRRHEVLDAAALALEFVRRAAATHTQTLEATGRTLAALESLTTLVPRTAEAAAVLDAALPSETAGDNLGLFTPDGQLLASVHSPLFSGVTDRPFFARAVVTGRPTIDDYAIDVQKRTASVAMAHPVLDADGRTDRVILRVFDVGWLRELWVEELLPAGTCVAVFDRDGTLVAQYPRVAASVGRTAQDRTLMDAALRADGEGTLEATAFDGVRRTYAFAPLRDSRMGRKLFVAVGIPTAAATAVADRTLVLDFVGFGVGVILAIVVASAAGDRLVVRHVRALATAAHRFGRGDTTARAGTEGRPAELAQLASTFDMMADAFVSHERKLVRQRDWAAVQERRVRAILENSTEGVSLHDATGRWIYISPATARILGRSREDLLGRHAKDLVHPEDLDAMEAAQADLLNRLGGTASLFFRLRYKDRTWRWIACDARNLLADPAVGALLATCRDITEYRETQDELRHARDELDVRVRQRTAELVKANAALESEIAERRRTQERLQKVSHAIDQTADSVFVTDRAGVIEYVNPAFETMTGYCREEAIGQTPRLFASGLHDARFYETLWSTLMSGRVFRSIVTNKAKDGRLFDEDQTITPMRDDGGTITHFVATGRDITERKRTEQAVRRLNNQLEQETTRIADLLHDEAGQFLTSAHIMLADLARDVPARTRERLQEVRRHLDQVEQQLRTISHDLHPRILTDLGLVGTLRFRAESFARRTGIKVVVETVLDYQPPPGVQAALYRLVQEGLTNAAKYAHARSVTVRLSDDGQHICCVVQDDGCGFEPAEVLERRGDPCLGIQNMRDRIEALGGTLEVVSKPSHGTLLRAVLPLEG